MKKQSYRITAGMAACVLTASMLPVMPAVHAAGTTLTVGKNGTYRTVGEAVAAAAALNPSGESSRVTVAIEPGLYREQLLINTPYLTFTNSNPSGGEVVLTWYYGIGYQYYSAAGKGYYNENDARSKSAKGKAQRWGTATRLQSGAKYFRAENIRFENSFNLYVTDEELADGVEPTGESITVQRSKGMDVTAKSATERAAAMCVEADYCEFNHCTFVGSQDTLYTANPAYFKECKIQGNTDYIFGSGDVVFDTCELCFGGYSDNAAGGYITAARQQTLGYLFWNCNVTANPGKMVGAGFFGRPWKDTAHVLFYNTTLPYEAIIQGPGWTSMGGVNPAQATFREYHTTVNGNPVNTSARVNGTVLNSCDATREQYLGNWTPYYLNGTIVETGAKIDTSVQYYIRNKKSGLYLSIAGGNVCQTEKLNAFAWDFRETSSGYYTISADDVAVTLASAEEGANAELSEKGTGFKLLPSGSSYELVTSVSEDQCCLSVEEGSDKNGANVLQIARNGEPEQQWELVASLPPVEGKLFNLIVFDREHAKDWSIAESVKSGDPVYGDRDVTLVSLPEQLTDAEYVRTACNSKNVTGNLAEITAKEAVRVYVGVDTRIDPAPAWLADWEQTELRFDNTGDVHFQCYAKELAAGETLTLGENSQSSYSVNYTVFVQKETPAETTAETTTTTTTTTTETTTLPETETTTETTVTTSDTDEPTTAEQEAAAGLPGDVNGDNLITVSDAILLARVAAEDKTAVISEQGKTNGDLDGKAGLSAEDVTVLLKYLAGILTELKTA